MNTKLRFTLAIVLAMGLAACGGGGGDSAPAAAPTNTMDAAAWTADAVQPVPHPEGWALDIPTRDGNALQGESRNYITTASGSLAGKTKVTLHARWEFADGTKIVPRRFPDSPSLMTLYFQRSGDDWTAQGKYETYRWYASFGTVKGITPGDLVMTARFDQNWTAVLGSSRATKPEEFAAAMVNAGRIGFVLGGGDGLGHGVYATGPARLVVKSFVIE
jgi:hypothetical protein